MPDAEDLPFQLSQALTFRLLSRVPSGLSCRSSMTPERWTRIKTLFHEALLNQAVDDRDLMFAKVYSLWDPLRSDPRFGELLKRMNLQ